MKDAVVLVSGGLDSATLLHYVRRRLRVARVRALTFRYGQRHEREIAAARWQVARAGAIEHRVVDISFLGRMTAAVSALTGRDVEVPRLEDLTSAEKRQPPTYVPNRNLVFLSLAAAYAESTGVRDVFYGAQAHDDYGYWDCTEAFVARVNVALRLNRRRPVRVHAPFVRLGKAAVLKIGLELGVDYAHTWTCYRGGRRPCGTCPSCRERASAFRRAGVRDPGNALR